MNYEYCNKTIDTLNISYTSAQYTYLWCHGCLEDVFINKKNGRKIL